MGLLPSNSSEDFSIIEAIEKQAYEKPEAIAVVFGKDILTFNELDRRSNQLANYLKSKGVKEEGLYPICMDRSLEMIIGILGILKAGGAYVPIDPQYPQERIDLILKETESTLVLTHQKSSPKFNHLPDQSIIMEWEDIQSSLDAQSADKLQTKIKPHHLAYVIFTSGSTGTPKGVLVEHAQLLSSTLVRNLYYPKFSCTLLVPSFSFDASVGPIFGSLSQGSCLMISSQESLQDPEQLRPLLAQTDSILCVPSYYRFLLDEGLIINSKLSTVILGGEALSQELVSAHFALPKGIALFNEYGPTEATVWATVKKVEPGETPVSIGSPIANAEAYILDESGGLVPEGTVGEIHIGGMGLARGYLNDESLTKEKFIDNPFGTMSGSRMYKTGDLGYWLSDQQIVFVGRKDDQVKINGHRVEPGEIETVLEKCSTIKQAVVIAKESARGDKQLVAFIIPKGRFDQPSVKEFLKNKLAAYMIPHVWVELESLPLNAHGKVDRQALRMRNVQKFASRNYEGPRNTAEKSLVAIWQELLQLDRIGIHDDFFEMGGNSLIAMRCLAYAKRELNIKGSVKDIFQYPTVGQLLGHLQEDQQKHIYFPIKNTLQKSNIIPLSFNQESLWFIDQLEGSVAYNLPIALKITGKLQVEALTKSLKHIITRHEVLRTVICGKEDHKDQFILDADDWKLSEIKGSEYQSNKSLLLNKLSKLIQVPFDLSKDYMLRASLIRISPKEHVLLLVLHHIAFDAWSASILFKDLLTLYHSYKQNREPSLSQLPIQYSDYAAWQRSQFEQHLEEGKINYWKKKLDGLVPLQLPTDFPNPEERSSRGAMAHFLLPSKLSDDIRELAGKENVTLFMVLLAAFKVLLYRYSSQEDICIGTAVAGRQEPETEDLIGYFINPLALRSQVNGKAPFLDFLNNVKSTTLESFEHQDVPFEKVVAEVVAEREKNQHPLFQVMFLLQNVPEIPSLEMEGAALSLLAPPQHTSKFDLTFSLTETPGGLKGTVEYRTDLYGSQTIERMIGHYRELLQSIILEPTKNLGSLNLLNPEEKHQLLVTYNDNTVLYPKAKTIVDLLEEQAKNTPDNLALTFDGQHLSYQQLNERSNQLAHLLKNKGVVEETLVLVCLERSLEMVIAILGILKAGAAYVPIDPEYPMERIKFIQEDTRARFAVSSRKNLSKLPDLKSLALIDLSQDQSNLRNLPTGNLHMAIQPHHLAYVIYTSGSTGTPKGVMIEHGNVYSFMVWCREEFGTSPFEMVYASTSICFDLSVFELFYPLSLGKTIRILQNGLQISQYLSDDSLVMINTVPSVVDHLLQENVDLTHASVINMAGETIPEKTIKKLDPEKTEIRNLYGPTEDTTYSTCYRIDKEKKILIGKPISNTGIYIVSTENELNPVGVPGEICIGGSGLSRGYLHRKELTDEKFVPNPFLGSNSSMYRTGDLGRWLEDGQIEYLGRIDDQVKIRGFRIELGEIERVLQLCEGVNQATVLAKDDHLGNKRLIAYVVFEGDFQRKKLMDFLKQKLPAYMIPNLWIRIDRMPLTPNGKINKKALPDPDLEESGETGFVAPRNITEKRIAQIWQKLLKLERVGIYDSFFQLGGHSLLAISFITAANKQFEVDLHIKDLFVYPTIAGLTEKRHFKVKSRGSSLIEWKKPRPEQIPLSYHQESLWFIDKLNGSLPYHIPIVFNVSGELNSDALAQALKQIVQRHEVLRTVIRSPKGSPWQSIQDADNWTISIIDGNDIQEAEELEEQITKIISEPFDLSQDYMLRATLIHMDQQNQVLIVVLHHIAADGWSIPIFIEELIRLYHANQVETPLGLPPLSFQYADYAVWQREQLNGSFLENKIQYWKEKLRNLSTLKLPTDYPKPAVHSIQGDIRSFNIDKGLYDQLLSLGQQQGATLFMTLLAAFKVLLARYSSQQDICVGTATAGRQLQDTGKLIGYFINPLPIRSWLDLEATFNEVLEEIKTNSLEAFENQELPFDKIVAAVGTERDGAKNPLFQVMFILQNFPEFTTLDLGHVKLSQKHVRQTTSKFDLSLIINQNPNGLSGFIEYSTDLYKRSTIDDMVHGYLSLLKLMVSNPFQKIKSLEFSENPAGFKRYNHSLSVSSKKEIQAMRGYSYDAMWTSHGRHFAETPKEKLIARIWEDALALKNINVLDNFFEIGGHSLIAVQVMAHLEKELGAKLPLTILFEYPTIRKLAQAVESKNEKTKDWNSLIPIKPHGKKSPLYIIPGGGANVLPFYSIGKNLDPEQPLFGLQPKGLNDLEAPLTSVQDIATHLVNEILRHNPKGPYSLAGYSFGGIIGFEMAKQLQRAGKEVKHLIMFDTIAFQSDHGEERLVKLKNKLSYKIGKRWFDLELLKNYPKVFRRLKKESFHRKLNNLKIILGLEKKDIQPSIMNTIKKLEAIHLEAAKNYVLEPYDGAIYLLKAKIPTYYIPEPHYLGWKPYVNQVHIREMEGEHTTMFNPPHETGFAQVLQEILDG